VTRPIACGGERRECDAPGEDGGEHPVGRHPDPDGAGEEHREGQEGAGGPLGAERAQRDGDGDHAAATDEHGHRGRGDPSAEPDPVEPHVDQRGERRMPSDVRGPVPGLEGRDEGCETLEEGGDVGDPRDLVQVLEQGGQARREPVDEPVDEGERHRPHQ